MRRYGWDYGDEMVRRGSGGRRPRDRAAPWLARPLDGRVGDERFYGEPRGARYGDRYDQGFAPLSEMNPIARQLRREYHGLAPGSWRRACRPRYGRDYY